MLIFYKIEIKKAYSQTKINNKLILNLNNC